MIKIFCDRCGNEIKFGWKGVGKEWATKMEFNEDKHHFCPKCFNEFIKWRDLNKKGKKDGKRT